MYFPLEESQHQVINDGGLDGDKEDSTTGDSPINLNPSLMPLPATQSPKALELEAGQGGEVQIQHQRLNQSKIENGNVSM